jgi:hypothetical protein
MVGDIPKSNEKVLLKSFDCDHCGKGFVDGYDLTIFSNRVQNKSEQKHFCSINCLARWVGERGWLYELHLRGIHALEPVVEHPVKYVLKN